MSISSQKKSVAIIGGGPAGLMAAEVLSGNHYTVNIFDAMPTMARKFLRAGIGGLNITYDEPLELFLDRYYQRRHQIEPLLKKFTPEDLIAWVHSLGIKTFVGSSHRVFPIEKKAAPLLRAWLQRLRASGVKFHPRHQWVGWNSENALRFNTPAGEIVHTSDAVLLALGGASWPQLGSDGSWVSLLENKGISIAPLRPANCGFTVDWSPFFKKNFAGAPLKSVKASMTDIDGILHKKQGECLISETGIEGGLIYALSAYARNQIEKAGQSIISLDLNPQRSLPQLIARLTQPKGKASMAKYLKNKVNITGVKAALLREYPDKKIFSQPELLAQLIKAFPITLLQPNPIADVISTAGGIYFDELNEAQMLKKLNGVFCAGEMLDWEAPTGGYLLSACIASGYAAGQGINEWLQHM